LKHVYNKHRNYSISYPTAICHGDLNLQNILLDESMNVYLIDFSETRPRAAIADFARIEAIMMIDRADVEDELNWVTYADFLEDFYGKDILTLETLPAAEWTGNDKEWFRKQMFVTQKMRHYAKLTVPNHSMIFPYYIALLEWILPVICYTVSLPRRKMATVAASIICQRLTESGLD
jgi:serine/threonine protein kinase